LKRIAWCQIPDLFDNRDRIGHTARPKGVLDLINLGADGVGQYGVKSASTRIIVTAEATQGNGPIRLSGRFGINGDDSFCGNHLPAGKIAVPLSGKLSSKGAKQSKGRKAVICCYAINDCFGLGHEEFGGQSAD
jgi:hypothetical protein